LAVAVGSAGAFVTFNGALGTPSSGTVTNLTGTASININGTVGATTPASVAATTLSATGVTTVQAGTALLPAIIPSGDPNTGIWFPAADTVAVSTGGAERMRIDSSGQIGIGATPTRTALLISKPLTGSSTTAEGVRVDGEIQIGITSTARGFISGPTQIAGVTLGTLNHFEAVPGTFNGTVTTQTGFVAQSSLTGATNNYGFYGNIAAAANRWNFYAAGTADNYFGGSVGVGTTSLTDIKFAITATPTSTTNAEYGIYAQTAARNTSGSPSKYGALYRAYADTGYAGTGNIIAVAGQADNTIVTTVSACRSFYSTINNTAAGTITVATHYTATNATNSGGGTITDQTGLDVNNLTAGATNYGLRLRLTSGAAKWNIYADGSAQNALLGLTSLGKTTAPTVACDTTSFGCGIVTNTGATYTVLITDTTIIQTTAASTYTLPAAASFTGRILNLVTQFAGTVISASSNVVPIAGGSAGTAILAATAGKWAKLQSNGTSWIIIASN
jgi:hypothetical protein